MGKVFDGIDETLRAFVERQALFFVATAPLAADGHVNLSPKGPMGSLRILGPHSVAYLDVVGSGAETIAHLRENGRIVIMVCAFSGPPRVVRLHGQGKVHEPGEPRYDELLAQAAFEDPSRPEARRTIVEVDVVRVADACGYGVPLMSFEGTRPHMPKWAEKKVRVGALEDYKADNNAKSLDGLPAL